LDLFIYLFTVVFFLFYYCFVLPVQEYDYEELERFSSSMLENVLSDLGTSLSEAECAEVRSILDPFQYQYVENHGFCDYIVRRAQKATDQSYDIQHVQRVSLEVIGSGTRTKFVAPARGVVKVNVVETFVQNAASDAAADHIVCLTSRQCHRIVEAAHQSTNTLQMLTKTLEGRVLCVEEAKMLFSPLFALLDDAVATVGLLLPKMVSSFDANLLIKCCIGYDMNKIRRLKQRIGPIFNTITGMYSGFYAIDFSNSLSRQCWKHLLERSIAVTRQRKADELGEITQNGDGIHGFRNIVIVKPPVKPPNAVATGKMWDVALSPEAERAATLAPFFEVSTIPNTGKLEFDFVNCVSLDHSTTHKMSDATFVRVRFYCITVLFCEYFVYGQQLVDRNHLKNVFLCGACFDVM
jgi:hypothetical protein